MSDSTPRVDSTHYRGHDLQEFGWILKAPRWVFLEKQFKENNDRLRDALQLFER